MVGLGWGWGTSQSHPESPVLAARLSEEGAQGQEKQLQSAVDSPAWAEDFHQ